MVEDDLSAASITHNLTTSFIGRRVIYYPRLTSTMHAARQEARQGALEGTVVVAGEQTAGKGRIKRIWLSPKNNIALSIVLYPDMCHLPYLIMLASLAVVHSIEEVTGLKAQIKWPNDVLIHGKKVCGILIESDVQAGRVAYAIVGIGINVNLRLNDFPEILQIATSLATEVGREVSRVDMIRCLLAGIEKYYVALLDGESVFEEWRDRLVTLGRKVQVKSGENILEGIAESVFRDGSLLVRLADGGSTKIVAGDVTLRDMQRGRGTAAFREDD